METPICSFFRAPISNTIPEKEINLIDIFSLITGNTYSQRTLSLRQSKNEADAKKFKSNNFDYVTFSGTFSRRKENSILKHSGLITIDFDHVDDLDNLKKNLLSDVYFETELLFISPSGDGLKWIVPIDLTQAPHSDYFKAISIYIKKTYKIEIDQSGSDISRACFLAHDENAFINPKYHDHE
jgi:hypothetical protein